MAITRTIGPLHFEDLEPHRFEDLVRQLAFGFRRWSSLDSTGRLGTDGGVDILGVEAVVPSSTTADDSADDAEPHDVDEREWRVQCKRYKSIRPAEMKRWVEELIPDPAAAPYGIVVAAACDVSATTISTFRTTATGRGAREAHLWTKAHIEDMLFRPENDQLLFAYFGISLGIRRASNLRNIRAVIATKNKVLRALEVDDLTTRTFKEIVVRDVAYTGPLARSEVLGYAEMEFPPWHRVDVQGFHPIGLDVAIGRYDGWLRPDGSWDVLEATETLHGGYDFDARKRANDEVPAGERVSIVRCVVLPYRNILEVDRLGDLTFDDDTFVQMAPHFYCEFAGQDLGPYAPTKDGSGLAEWWEAKHIADLYSPWQQLDPSQRAALFS